MKSKLLFAICFAASVNLVAQPTQSEQKKTQLPPEASQNWYDKAMNGIAASEYSIAFSEADCGLRSHNRQSNFFVGFQGSGFTIQPKGEGETSINFTLNGIYADDNPALKADIKGYDYLNINNLVFWHNGFKEQYINTTEGLRQNFIIEKNLYANEIMVLLTISGAQLTNEGSDAITLLTVKGTKITYADLNVWDSSGNKLPAHMQVVGKNQIALVIQNTKNIRYPLTIDPLTRTISDWQVVGSQAGGGVGLSVAGAGDVNGDGFADVLVGAFSYSNGQTNEGAIFVYHGSAVGLKTTPSTIIEKNLPFLHLGTSVAGAGDVNNDGYSDIIIGAPEANIAQTNNGKVFIYLGSANGIDTTTVLQLTVNQHGAQFGCSVAGAGDVNGDGYDDVLVGAWMYDNGQQDEGAAFLFKGSANGIISTPAWQVESNQFQARMAYCVASAGDVNGDGFIDVIVGASGFDNIFLDEGAAFVYHGSALGLQTTAAIRVDGNQTDAYFGDDVASAGDINGDGYSDVIVAAPFYENGQFTEGAAFIYHGSQNGISNVASSVIETNKNFAEIRSATSAGDFNGDGFDDVIIGSPGYNANQNLEGVSFVFYGSPSGLVFTIIDTLQSNQGGSLFGWSATSAGDVNGDGYSDVIVGAYSYDVSQVFQDVGSAFVYHGMGNGLSIMPMSQQEEDQFAVYKSLNYLVIERKGSKGLGLQICIANMIGQTVFSENYFSPTEFLSIPVTLTEGIYVVMIRDVNTGVKYSQKMFW